MGRAAVQIALVLGVCAAVGGCGHFLPRKQLDYRTIKVDPLRDPERAQKENAQALKLIEKGKLAEAEQALQKALIADVTYGPAHNNLGQVYFQQHKYYLAAWEYEYAIKLMPQRAEPYNNLGLVYEAVGKLDDAIELLKTAMELEPGNPQFIGNLARVRIRRGDRDGDLRELLENIPFFDDRPDWVCWAEEQLALTNLPPVPPPVEQVPTPAEPESELPPPSQPSGEILPPWVQPEETLQLAPPKSAD